MNTKITERRKNKEGNEKSITARKKSGRNNASKKTNKRCLCMDWIWHVFQTVLCVVQ